MPHRALRFAAGSLAALVLGLAGPAVASARLPTVLTQSTTHPFAVRPAQISYTGDGTGVVGGPDGTSARRPGHLRWTTYNTRQARDRDRLDDCQPDCARGTFTPHTVHVHAFSSRGGRFTRLTLRYRYQGKDVTDRRIIHHIPSSGSFHGYWVYYRV